MLTVSYERRAVQNLKLPYYIAEEKKDNRQKSHYLQDENIIDLAQHI